MNQDRARAGHQPAHLDGVDLMRVLVVAAVIAVEVVAGTNKPTSVPAGAATILLHVSPQVFVFISALVLTFSYSARPSWSVRRFWIRRSWLAGLPYVAWTAIYLLADGLPSSPVAAARQFGLDLADGGARYHLYLLLVSLQMYLVFPLLLGLVRAARRWHGLLLGAGAVAQLAFTAAIHYRVNAGGPLAWWLAHPDALLPSYQLSVLAGAVLALRAGEVSAWVRRRGGLLLVLALLLAGTAAGLASYFYDVSFRVLAPVDASEVFQPAVTVESSAVMLALYALGARWGGRARPRPLARAVEWASDASFGVYLASPLVLQGLLAIAGLTGFTAAILRRPGRDTLAIGLIVCWPLVALATWAAVGFVRGGLLSLPLTGRQVADRKPVRGPAPAVRGMQTLAVAAALVAMVGWLDLSTVGPGAGAAYASMAVSGKLVATLAAGDAPVPPQGVLASLEDVDVGGVERSYQVLRPRQPAAARLPAIVFLHGITADIGGEEIRDGLLPMVMAGRVVLAYPVGYRESWNAGRCCGDAEVSDIDDVAFVTAVGRRIAADREVDPARVSLAGYSNGGKMAYRVACERPGAFATVTVVLALPMTPCASSGPPVSLLQVAVRDDPELPYAPGDGPFQADGVVLTPVTKVVAFWRGRDGCAQAAPPRVTGRLAVERWSGCHPGSRVELATYASGGHYWPSGDAATPPAGQVLWNFVSAAA